MSRPRSDAAFSLIEALVALAVFAMAGVALVQLQTHSLTTLTRVETRALAGAIAQNRLTEIVASTAKPVVGARDEEVQFAQRAWRVRTEIAAGADPAMRRASISVSDGAAATPAATASGFFLVPEGAP